MRQVATFSRGRPIEYCRVRSHAVLLPVSTIAIITLSFLENGLCETYIPNDYSLGFPENSGMDVWASFHMV
jgi:hypothetical protein